MRSRRAESNPTSSGLAVGIESVPSAWSNPAEINNAITRRHFMGADSSTSALTSPGVPSLTGSHLLQAYCRSLTAGRQEPALDPLAGVTYVASRFDRNVTTLLQRVDAAS